LQRHAGAAAARQAREHTDPRDRRRTRPARRRRLLLRAIVASALLAAGALAALTAVGLGWWRQGVRLAQSHLAFESVHRGWSFPARIYSDRVPLTEPAERLIEEAKARGYRERCPHPRAGEYCAKKGAVVPRRGDELEPLLLGWIVGPDAEIREHLPLDQAPRHLIDAIIAAEDRSFREHAGVDFVGLVRAALTNARRGGYRQGASTLSMQVVRAFSGQRERALARKLREATMALAIDSYLGKDGVLQAYLDIPYLGQRGGLSICGFQAAARHYFGKDARDLDLAEAATLAAILPAPGRFAPDRHPRLAKQRRDRVLLAMAELQGYDVRAALERPVKTVPPARLEERHSAYLSAVRAWLFERLPEQQLYGTGLVVTAGVDLRAQRVTEELFAEATREFDRHVTPSSQPLQSAGVLLDPETGRLLALWGGTGLTATGFNRATQAFRQAGSAFKPLVYALAFGQPPREDGSPRFTASSLEPNAPRVFHTEQGDWRPRNASHEYTPTATLADGLIWSRNIATASLLEELGGPRALIDFARSLGFSAERFPAEMGLALGQGEVTVLQMAQLAAAIGNGGWRVEGAPVVRVVDWRGRELVSPPERGPRVISSTAAALTRELMRQVIVAGTGGAAARGLDGAPGYHGPAIGKTGTTDEERDVWFVGATPRHAAAVWLGRDEPEGLGHSASELAAPLWGWWMRRLARRAPAGGFADEVELTHRWICASTGRLAGAACRPLRAPFLPGTEPKARCGQHHPELHEAENLNLEAPSPGLELAPPDEG
jgi:membrane peptidoglycan carboxypeptidase